MPSPPVAVFLTTIASQPALRQRQEYILRTLQVKKIPFTSYDLASDEDAKRLWKRKAPPDKQQLPGILVGGTFPGTFQDFEEAVEFNELDRFLRLSESWKDDNEDSLLTGPKLPPARPIGVPGAMMPLQMTPEHLKKKVLAQPPKSLLSSGGGGDGGGGGGSGGKPTPVNKRQGVEMDLGDALSGFGLQGVKVMEDELLDMVKDLGLDDDAAGDLVKGLSGSTGGKKNAEADKKEKKEEADKRVEEEKKEDKFEQKVEGRKEDNGNKQVKDTESESGTL